MEQHHLGTGDNIGRDKIIHNHLYDLYDYKKLLEDINDLTEDLKENLSPKLVQKKQKKLQTLRKQEIQFKESVFSLYETLTKISRNTERLKLAKAHIDNGEFREADAILKAEEISQEILQLKEAKNKKEQEISKIDKSLEDKANEFLIKAQLWKTFYSEADWFEKTTEFYENSLDASRSHLVIFEYALFLQNQNQFNEAETLYEEALQIRREFAKENPRTYLPFVATTLNNLAVLQKDRNKFSDALKKYEEALQIKRKFARDNPYVFLPDVAMTIANLSKFYLYSVPNKKKSIALAKEVLEIAKQFPDNYKVQQDAQKAIQVLQANGVDVEKLLLE